MDVEVQERVNKIIQTNVDNAIISSTGVLLKDNYYRNSIKNILLHCYNNIELFDEKRLNALERIFNRVVYVFDR